MGILEIFCCSGDSEETRQSNTTNYQSKQTDKEVAKKSYRSKEPATHLHSNTPTSNSKNSPKMKKQSSLSSSDPHSNETQVNTKTGPTNYSNNKSVSNESSKQDLNNVEHTNKADVNVYEATDSTVETGNDHATSSVLVDEYSQNEPDSSYNSSHNESDGDAMVIDADVAQNLDNEEFLDLTRLQPGQAHAASGWLLDPAPSHLKNRKCLVLDLDETLVHSSFKYLRQADFVIPVDIDNQLHNVYVIKRPGVDEFMRRVGELYEVVVFTASVSRYGDPLLDALDIHKSVHHRLFRDSCYNYQGNYIKNLSQIGRPLSDLIILDNSPASYIFHPQHAIPISSWFSDAHDNELLDIMPFLEDLAKENVEDVGLVLDINL